MRLHKSPFFFFFFTGHTYRYSFVIAACCPRKRVRVTKAQMFFIPRRVVSIGTRSQLILVVFSLITRHAFPCRSNCLAVSLININIV